MPESLGEEDGTLMVLFSGDSWMFSYGDLPLGGVSVGVTVVDGVIVIVPVGVFVGLPVGVAVTAVVTVGVLV